MPRPSCSPARSGSRRLVVLRPGVPPKPLASVPGATRLSALGAGDPRIAIGFADGRVELRDPSTPAVGQTIATLPASVWGLAFNGVDLVAGFGGDVDLVPVVESPGVDLSLPAEHYLASWTRVDVKPRGGVSFDDLAFVVDPPYGGLVSASRDASFDPAQPARGHGDRRHRRGVRPARARHEHRRRARQAAVRGRRHLAGLRTVRPWRSSAPPTTRRRTRRGAAATRTFRRT